MELFPATIAIGRAFYDRVQERKILTQYIKKGMNVVVVAPRRYGKSSLINQVLLESKLPYTIMEFTMVTTAKDVEQIIIKKIGELLHSILPRSTKAKHNILKLFKFLNPEVILTVSGQKVVFHPQLNDNATDTIAEVLLKLDKAAEQEKKRVVVVMDEFQELNELKGHTIEASIRHAMQYSKNVSYVFSGSNRHMLESMFNDKNRPFYSACEIMRISRIATKDYEDYIQKEAIKKWGKKFTSEIIAEIFNLSELHPNYINKICGHFWLLDEYPSLEKIREYWQNLIQIKSSDFTKDLLNMSKNQRRLLRYLAHKPVKQPSSREVYVTIDMSEASLRQALRKLLLLDFIYKDKEGFFRILDPALKDFVRQL